MSAPFHRERVKNRHRIREARSSPIGSPFVIATTPTIAQLKGGYFQYMGTDSAGRDYFRAHPKDHPAGPGEEDKSEGQDAKAWRAWEAASKAAGDLDSAVWNTTFWVLDLSPKDRNYVEPAAHAFMRMADSRTTQVIKRTYRNPVFDSETRLEIVRYLTRPRKRVGLLVAKAAAE